MCFQPYLFSQSLYLGPLKSFATPAQKEKFMKPFLDGDRVGCFGLSEPGERYIKGQISFKEQGRVVQSIISLTSLLRDQLVKCCTTLSPKYTLIFSLEKMREALHCKSFSHLFNKNILAYFIY